MKSTFFPPSASGGNSRGSTRGVALVLVLAILLLITGFVLAFYSSVSSELVSAKSYAGGSSGKQLADAATQMAVGTIRKATSQTSQANGLGSANLSGTDIAWASQPGMIRTWDSNGSALKCYKLFSSDNLEVDVKANGAYTPVNDSDTAFDSKPAIFTDLNAPITLSGEKHYPIIDPSVAIDPATGTALTTPLVTGFSIDTSVRPATTSVPDPAPMPVRWIYVLQDGTMSTPTAGSTTATFAGTGTPTAANPIVGRIAYWTDDDTCKVNINTASEGVYWDVPHIVSREDLGNWNGHTTAPSVPGLSVCQPATGEYQRYAGHPATTSLSPVLGGLIPALNAPNSSTTITPAIASASYEPFYDLIPRVSWGGSQAGTVIPRSALQAAEKPLISDSDRLFASVDEFIFRTPTHGGTVDLPRQVNSSLADPNDAAAVASVRTGLEKSRFFLTAHNSAPEVTMFNTPRVSMWPVWAANTHARTVLDSTLAFCADLKASQADSPYYFTRNNSRSTTDDFTRDASNGRLYNYLQKMMSTSVPGFGGKFSDAVALGADCTQVLTNIYDYIRCINMYDKTTGATPYTGTVKIGGGTWGGGEVVPIKINGTQGFGRFATLAGMDLVFAGVPAPPSTTPGAQAPPADVTARVQVMLVPTFFSPMQGLPAMFPHVYYTIKGQSAFTLKASSSPTAATQIFKSPQAGGDEGTNWIANIPAQQNVGRGLGSMLSPRVSLGSYGPFNGGDPTPAFSKPYLPGASVGPANPPTQPNSGSYPFVSYYQDPVRGVSPNVPLVNPLPATPAIAAPATMDFVGGKLDIQLFSGEGELLQTYEMVVPNGTFPVPKVSGTPLFGTKATPDFSPHRNGTTFSAFDDVTRGIEVAGLGDAPDETSTGINTTAGDVRMIAALPKVSKSYYHPHQNWADSSRFMASGMEDDDGSNSSILPDHLAASEISGRGSHGALAAKMYPRNGDSDGLPGNNPSYGYKSPYVPSRVYTPLQTGVTRTNNAGTAHDDPGDWDTGYALLPDGPHLNMGDIGDGAYIDEVQYPAGSNYAGMARYPYVVKEDHFNSDRYAGTYFSPNRQVPSSMVLGSIPTGVQRFQPWQTLLFSPKPEDLNHPGRRLPTGYTQPGTVPPDHLIADLFWMPVVQPYPISQPFSTAGKINMNYQIEPFSYIKRATGIYAVLKSTKMLAIPASTYNFTPGVTGTGIDPKPLVSSAQEAVGVYSTGRIPNARLGINMDETLKGFEAKFGTNDIFRSASQISEINLVPVGTTYADIATFWKAHTMSGDNLREKPYVDVYPRLTTKSNSYTVHFRVQVLQKVPNTPVAQWVEGKDQIVSEYRGSSEIERYLDSSASNLPDFATLMANDPTDKRLNLDQFYRYRIVSTKRFSPY